MMRRVRAQRANTRASVRTQARVARNAGVGVSGVRSAVTVGSGSSAVKRGASVVAQAAKGGGPNEMKSFMTYLSTAPVLIMVVGYVCVCITYTRPRDSTVLILIKLWKMGAHRSLLLLFLSFPPVYISLELLLSGREVLHNNLVLPITHEMLTRQYILSSTLCIYMCVCVCVYSLCFLLLACSAGLSGLVIEVNRFFPDLLTLAMMN